MVSVGLFLAFYYNVLVSWAIWYLAASLADKLEWSQCEHWYNSPTCWSEQTSPGTVVSPCRDTNSSCEVSSAPAEYYERYVLGNRGHDWHNFGHLRPQSVACLAAAWGIVALCLIKGIKTSGKVAYFTSLFPYLVLVVLAGRALTLPGASEGLRYYLTADWSLLADPKLWVDAATQVIFSLGPGELHSSLTRCLIVLSKPVAVSSLSPPTTSSRGTVTETPSS